MLRTLGNQVVVNSVVNHARYDRWHMVEAAIEGGFDPNAAHSVDGYTALHWAARGLGPPSVATVQWLLAHGADPNLRNRDGDSPVCIAACVGSAPVLRALIDGGGVATGGGGPDACTGLVGLVRFGVGDAEARLRVLVGAPGLTAADCAVAEQRARQRGQVGLVSILAEEGAMRRRWSRTRAAWVGAVVRACVATQCCRGTAQLRAPSGLNSSPRKPQGSGAPPSHTHSDLAMPRAATWVK